MGLRITQQKDLHTFMYYAGFCIIQEYVYLLTKAMTNPVLSITYISRLVKYSFALIINLVCRAFLDPNIPGLTTARAVEAFRVRRNLCIVYPKTDGWNSCPRNNSTSGAMSMR